MCPGRIQPCWRILPPILPIAARYAMIAQPGPGGPRPAPCGSRRCPTRLPKAIRRNTSTSTSLPWPNTGASTTPGPSIRRGPRRCPAERRRGMSPGGVAHRTRRRHMGILRSPGAVDMLGGPAPAIPGPGESAVSSEPVGVGGSPAGVSSRICRCPSGARRGPGGHPATGGADPVSAKTVICCRMGLRWRKFGVE